MSVPYTIPIEEKFSLMMLSDMHRRVCYRHEVPGRPEMRGIIMTFVNEVIDSSLTEYLRKYDGNVQHARFAHGFSNGSDLIKVGFKSGIEAVYRLEETGLKRIKQEKSPSSS